VLLLGATAVEPVPRAALVPIDELHSQLRTLNATQRVVERLAKQPLPPI